MFTRTKPAPKLYTLKAIENLIQRYLESGGCEDITECRKNTALF